MTLSEMEARMSLRELRRWSAQFEHEAAVDQAARQRAAMQEQAAKQQGRG